MLLYKSSDNNFFGLLSRGYEQHEYQNTLLNILLIITPLFPLLRNYSFYLVHFYSSFLFIVYQKILILYMRRKIARLQFNRDIFR